MHSLQLSRNGEPKSIPSGLVLFFRGANDVLEPGLQVGSVVLQVLAHPSINTIAIHTKVQVEDLKLRSALSSCGL
jgi:hypothetical protein